jgi:PEP-CTERM motif
MQHDSNAKRRLGLALAAFTLALSAQSVYAVPIQHGHQYSFDKNDHALTYALRLDRGHLNQFTHHDDDGDDDDDGGFEDGHHGHNNPPPRNDVPEPSSLALIMLGLLGIAGAERLFRRRDARPQRTAAQK